MTRKAILVCMVLIFAAGTAVSADTPEADEIIDKMIAAVGGDGLDKLEVIRLEVAEEKTHNDGNFSKNSYVAYVDMSAIDTMRLEMDGGVVLGRNGGQSWATNKGVVDDRPQTPYMAKGTLNQTLFPLLLPYSLRMEGVWVKEVGEITWDGREAWTLIIPFAKGFFVSPVLTTTWRVVVAKDDYSLLATDFLPPYEYRDVELLGMRYRTLKYDDVNGAKIPSQILALGINTESLESGANRITRIKPTAYGPWEPGLFMSPAVLDAIEGP